MSRVPLRLRVALAFALTTAVALTGLGAFVYLRVEDTLRDQALQSLNSQVEALSSLNAEQRERAVGELSGLSFAQVLSSDGELVASSPQLRGVVVDRADLDTTGAMVRKVRLAADDEAEPALVRVRDLGGQMLVVGRSQEPLEEALDGLLTQLLIGVPIALLVASGAGYGVAGAALRPVERMRGQAATISALDAQTRLPLPVARDEMHRLGSTLNAMLDRLDAAASREREFVAEASHELRTPLALLRMELDLALARPRTPDELLAALRSTSEEVERLTVLAEDLLLLADSDGDGARVLESAQVPVDDLVHQVARRFAPLAERAGRTVSAVIEENSHVRGDPARLGRALGNLVHNALLHGEGVVTVRARLDEGWAVIGVEDEGPGIPEELRERAFERMSRAPGARASRGHGLGLAIVRVIVEEHDGTVGIVGGSEAGQGSVVVIRMPEAGRR